MAKPNPAGCKFAFADMEWQVSSVEEDVVSHIKLQVPMFFVILCFLLLLCLGESLLCLCNQVLYVFVNVDAAGFTGC